MMCFVFVTPAEWNMLQTRITNLEKGLQMANAAVEAMRLQIEETNGVMESTVVFISNISAQLAAVQAELADVGVNSATLDELRTGLDERSDALAAAVAANSPPAPPPAI